MAGLHDFQIAIKAPNFKNSRAPIYPCLGRRFVNASFAVSSMIVNYFISSSALKPYYFKPTAVDIDYNVRYSRNTFISASRAISDYFLTLR